MDKKDSEVYDLYVSHDCGISYQLEQKGETLAKLNPIMDKLDDEMLRYYLEKDNKFFPGKVCNIHKLLIKTATTILNF